MPLSSSARFFFVLCYVALCYLQYPCKQTFAFQSDGESLQPHAIEFFEKKIRPLLVTHCYECHAGKESNGGLRLDSRESLLKGGESGPAMVPNKPELSLLIRAVRYTTPELQMPPKGALSKHDIGLLEEWVLMGGPDPRSSIPSLTNLANGPTGMGIEEGRQFWSMRPISNPTVPETKDENWPRTPIDRFMLAKLDAMQLVPAPELDRRNLVRRMTLAMTGLPPTVEEMDLFVADDAPDAVDRLIERLLNSPQYGVHWGRHWLDVARYADSNGLDENIAYGNAWRYRDYVVDSFNRDKPIDTFIVEQIAGDLIPNSSIESITGTGFLVLGAKVLAEPDREKLTMDTIDEQLDTLGKAFLGLTIGCARCHDHKFDPILQRDYYALATIFKSTKTFGDTNFGAIKHWNEFSIATAAEKEELKKIQAEISKKQSAVSSLKSKSMEELRAKTRSMASEYLATAPLIKPDMTLQEISELATPRGLHPRILFHCSRHLAFHSEHPLFAEWRTGVREGNIERIRSYYQDLFDRTERALAEAKKKDSKVKTLEDPILEMARAELYDPTGFLAVPPKPEFAFDESVLTELGKRSTEARLFESFAMDEPAVMAVSDGQIATNIRLHIRGNHRNLGESITRDFPEVMRTGREPTILPRKQSGRLEMARWLTGPSHPLTARVFVNRVWRWHFGHGLVSTTENFGALGDRPSHPELLDYLARSFIESGWSLKELHRTILRSSVYRMSSYHPDHSRLATVDPENRLNWKFVQQRMSAEQLRDSILFVCGQLDLRLGGKTVPLRNRQFVFDHTSIDNTRYDSWRRAIYLPVIRNNLYSLFEQFDFPDPTMPTGSRSTTTVAPQALLLMNSDWVLRAAEQALFNVDHAPSSEAKIQWLYRDILGRNATEIELERAIAFLSEANHDAWLLLAQSIVISNEFVFIQ
jgi:hypothetical protein